MLTDFAFEGTDPQDSARNRTRRRSATATKIFVNLPVRNLDRSIEFFKKLGFRFNPQFTDETAACLVIDDDIYAMLLTEMKFKECARKNEIADASRTTGVLTYLAVRSKDEVSRIVDTALGEGATETRSPMDYGFMFGRSFNDLDGHIWEIIWTDPRQLRQ
jgi:predicted lactoylglutathione lyase